MAREFDHGIPIYVELDKSRTIFGFGKKNGRGRRVDSITLSNNTGTRRKVAIEPTRGWFYWPKNVDSGFHSTRVAISDPTYFYATVPANSTVTLPPFFAVRGLKLSGQASDVHATVVAPLVADGDYKAGKLT